MSGHLPISGCAIHDNHTGSVTCTRSLSQGEAERLDSHLAGHPDAWLRVHKKLQGTWDFDLGFLAWLPSLRHLDVDADAGDLNDLKPLERAAPDLLSLDLDTLAPFSDKKLDKPKSNTDVLRRFRSLRSLGICGKLSGLDFLSDLTQLRELHLWRTGLKSLQGIQHLSGLERLEMRWLGPVSLSPVRLCGSLQALELWDSRTVKDVQDLAMLASLRRLWLISCGKALKAPDARHMSALKIAVVHGSTGPDNIAALAEAPNLKCLVISATPEKLKLADFGPLLGHPALREIRADEVEAGVLQRLSFQQGWKTTELPNFPADEYL